MRSISPYWLGDWLQLRVRNSGDERIEGTELARGRELLLDGGGGHHLEGNVTYLHRNHAVRPRTLRPPVLTPSWNKTLQCDERPCAVHASSNCF